MTGFQDVAPEELAQLFFHYREALAADFECAPAESGFDPCWEAVRSKERKLMVAAARMVLLELANNGRGLEDAIGDKNQASHGRIEGSEGKECGC
jgi:hypothetical protein